MYLFGAELWKNMIVIIIFLLFYFCCLFFVVKMLKVNNDIELFLRPYLEHLQWSSGFLILPSDIPYTALDRE